MSGVRVTLKLAVSLDGAIALASGESKWITGPDARAQSHTLRAAHDAVLVGIGSVLADDPELTARTMPPPLRQPLRVVLDRSLRLPPSQAWNAAAGGGGVIVLSTARAIESRPALQSAGVIIEHAPAGPGEGEIRMALRALSLRHDVKSVLVEGGGQVAAAFLSEGLVDQLELFRAPILIGGDGIRAVGDLGLTTLGAAPSFEWVASRRLGSDLWDSYRRR